MSHRALVIAVTRLGDIIQTEPMVRALKRRGKYESISVLVERSFADVALMNSSADEVKLIDFADILGRLDRTKGPLPMQEYVELVKWLGDSRFTDVYNVTHSRPSMMLAALAGPNAQGVTLNALGMQVVNNRWLQYFFATNLARPWCSFNLVDIYVNAVDPASSFVDRLPRLTMPSVHKRKSLTGQSDENVLLHVGASKSDKQWPLERFVAVAKYLLARNLNVTLVGGNRSKAIDGAFPAHKNFRSLMGETTVRDLFHICEEASLLISADSGPVHVAAACGLPIIAIEGGSAHGFETAPYIQGAYVIQPHLDHLLTRKPGKQVTSAPADLIGVEMVTSTIEYMLGERKSIMCSPQCTVYETVAGVEIPGLELRSVSGSSVEYEEWQQKLRKFWWRVGNGVEQKAGASDNDLSIAARVAAKSAESIAHASDDISFLEKCASNLSITEKSLSQLINANPPLHHLNYFLQIARSSINGETPQEQAIELETLYDDIAEAADELDLMPRRQSRTKSSYSNTEKVLA